MKLKKITSILLFAALFAGVFLISGCENKDNDSDKMSVAVSIVPEATFVKAVCGNLVEVVTLVPPGSSPENYEPTPAIMENFAKASVYFSIGVPTEETNILPNAGAVKIVALAEKVAQVYPDLTFQDGGRDPHIWLSPKRVKVMIDAIADEMSELDPDNAQTYKANADSYKAELDGLDAEIRSALEGVENRKIIVYHPAFGYLADDYGLTMYSLEEEGKEATAQDLQNMIDLAKAENIKVIFYQAEIDSSQSKAFAEEIGGKTVQLSPLAADYIENLKKMAQTMAEAMQ